MSFQDKGWACGWASLGSGPAVLNTPALHTGPGHTREPIFTPEGHGADIRTRRALEARWRGACNADTGSVKLHARHTRTQTWTGMRLHTPQPWARTMVALWSQSLTYRATTCPLGELICPAPPGPRGAGATPPHTLEHFAGQPDPTRQDKAPQKGHRDTHGTDRPPHDPCDKDQKHGQEELRRRLQEKSPAQA